MNKLRTVSRYFINTLLAAVLLCSCVAGIDYDCVEQKVDNKCEGLCPSGVCLTTYVWYKKELVKVWRDDINTVTDSLVKARQKQGDDLLVALKHSR